MLVNCIYKSSRAARSNLWTGFAAGRPAVTIVIISHILWASACAEGLGVCLFLRLEGRGRGVSGPREGTRVAAFHSLVPEVTSYHSADLSSSEPIGGPRPSGGWGVTHRCGYCQRTGRTIGVNVGNLQRGRDVGSALSLTGKVGVYRQGTRRGWSVVESY